MKNIRGFFMNKKIFFAFITVILILTVISSCKSQNENVEENSSNVIAFEPASEIIDGRKNIYVVLKVLNSQYWQTLAKGISDGAKKAECNVYIGASEAEGDGNAQLSLIDEAIDKGADGLIIAPADSSQLSEPLANIRNRNIPVVLVDTIVNNPESYDICYMTDNLKAGELAAKQMLSMLIEKGITDDQEATIAIQITSFNSQTVIDRLAGFFQYWSDNAPEKWKVCEDIKLNNGDKERAKQNCLEFIAENPNLKGVFGCNNSSTVGFVNGLKESNRDDIVLIGFDYADETALRIKNNDTITATVVQNQYDMGYDGINSINSLLKGEDSEFKFIDTGIEVINSDNYVEYEKFTGEK